MISTRSRIYLAGGIVLTLAACAITLFYLRSEYAFHRYERKLLASGEKLKISDWVPAPPPDGKNGVLLLRQVMSSLPPAASQYLGTNGPHAMRMCAPGKAIVAWAQPDVWDERTNSWDDELQMFASVKPALTELAKLSDRPWLDFDLDYNQGFNLMLPHLAPLKNVSQQLAIATIFDLHDKNSASAAQRIHTSLILVQALRREPLVISQLVRMAMAHITLTATWEWLQQPGISDDQLADLQRDWAALDFLKASEDSLGMERSMALQIADQMRRSSAQFRAISSGSGISGPGAFSSGGTWYEKAMAVTASKSRETFWRLALSYPDQLRAMKGQQALIESLRMVRKGDPYTLALDTQDKKLIAAGIERVKDDEAGVRLDMIDQELASLFSNTVRSLERFIVRGLKMEIARQLATTAIALKRYQLAHGNFPASLQSLVPDYLAALPLDPADGNPLRYRLEPDGNFKLYSIGDDGVDNGGDPTSRENQGSYSWQGRDYVWPQVATPDEVRAFQAEKAEKRRGRR